MSDDQTVNQPPATAPATPTPPATAPQPEGFIGTLGDGVHAMAYGATWALSFGHPYALASWVDTHIGSLDSSVSQATDKTAAERAIQEKAQAQSPTVYSIGKVAGAGLAIGGEALAAYVAAPVVGAVTSGAGTALGAAGSGLGTAASWAWAGAWRARRRRRRDIFNVGGT